MSTLTLSAVHKSFGVLPVLHDVDFSVAEGEMISLLGPSGCGKSTTLRCISGFESINSGEISVDGRVLSSAAGTVPPERRNLGIVFQSYAIWPHMTVFENIAFGLKVQRLARAEIERRVKDVLHMVGLADMGPKYPSTLSGGQQQRVAIARSLVVQPSLLLFDEPLSNLDAKLRDHMRAEIRAIQQRIGITAVYVTHDQVEALTMSDRIILMDSGRIVEANTPSALFNAPRTELAARFLGLANVWKGRTSSSGAALLDNGLPLCLSGEPPDGPLTVMVRPSCIGLDIGEEQTEPQLDGDETRWPAVIEEANFRGETTEIICQAPGCTVLITAFTHLLHPDVRPGQTCTLVIPAAQTRLLDRQDQPVRARSRSQHEAVGQ